MQAAANQVRWVPIGEIVEPWEESAEGEPDGAVVLSQRPDGRYTLVSGLNTLRRMRDAGQVCVDAVTCPAECMERRVARLLDQLMRGRLHYLDEAEEYRALLAAGMDPKELAARIGRTPATIRKKLRLVYEPVGRSALTDEKWLSFVLEQVLSNAIKYTSEGGVTIRLDEPLTLVVEDTGIGVAPEDLPRIFERGYTGLNGRADKSATGIGLYLCRAVMRKLGHEIAAESEPGRGTRIRLMLEAAKLEVE